MDLEILIVTYNRAEYLDRTLKALHAGPFAHVRTTVLDNASDDGTPDVCGRWQQRFDHLRIVRNPVNVGSGPNFLRAVELAHATYVWVLADDDEFDFSDCNDVIETLREAQVDLIAVGGPEPLEWPTGRTSMQALSEGGQRPFYVLSFIPSVIFRRQLFDTSAIVAGYLRVGDLYPQFPFLVRQLDRDASVQVCRRQMVHRTRVTVPNSLLWWMVRWVRCCQELGDRQRIREGVLELNAGRLAWWIWMLPSAVAVERLEHPERAWDEAAELALTLKGRLRVVALLALPVALGPRALYGLLQRSARQLRRRPVRDDVFSAVGDRSEVGPAPRC